MPTVMSRQLGADGVLKPACYMLVVFTVAFASVFMLRVHPGPSESVTASHSAILAHTHMQAVQLEEHHADRDTGNDAHRCSHGDGACCPDVHTCCAMASVLPPGNPLTQAGCVAARLPNSVPSPLVTQKLPPRG
jgi:hypothetical protein